MWPVDERTLPVELPKYGRNGESFAKHSFTTGCLPQRHYNSDTSSAFDIMRVVDDIEDNNMNDFDFNYSCKILE